MNERRRRGICISGKRLSLPLSLSSSISPARNSQSLNPRNLVVHTLSSSFSFLETVAIASWNTSNRSISVDKNFIRGTYSQKNISNIQSSKRKKVLHPMQQQSSLQMGATQYERPRAISDAFSYPLLSLPTPPPKNIPSPSFQNRREEDAPSSSSSSFLPFGAPEVMGGREKKRGEGRMVLTRAFAVLPTLGSERRAPLDALRRRRSRGRPTFLGGWLVGWRIFLPLEPFFFFSLHRDPTSLDPPLQPNTIERGAARWPPKEREKGFDPSSHPPKKTSPPRATTEAAASAAASDASA